jgi:hypothetical protein
MPRQTSNAQNKIQKRQRARIGARLDKNLLAYTLAASAAGVGMLALAEPAEARIVATPVNIPIPVNGGIVQFDINHDGIPDFGLSVNFYQFARNPPMGNFSSLVRVVPAQAENEVWDVFSDRNECAAAVHAGEPIGGARRFRAGPQIMLEAAGSYTRGRSSHCPWHGAHPPYLGLKFMIDGQVHYGWAQVMVAVRATVLTGFAYETIPNKPIPAGATSDADESNIRASAAAFASPSAQPASLGMLAIGSSGLVAWRKRERRTSVLSDRQDMGIG